MYDKQETKIIGFVDIDDLNNQLGQLENTCVSDTVQSSHPTVATHMLVLVVRGIFFQMEYPYAHFPTHRLTAASLFRLCGRESSVSKHWVSRFSQSLVMVCPRIKIFLRCILMVAVVPATRAQIHTVRMDAQFFSFPTLHTF